MNTKKPTSLNLNVRGLGLSATLAIKARCRQLRNEGKTVYDFGLGQSPFPVPTPVVEALHLAAHEKDYLPVEGLPELREAIAHFHKNKDGIEVHPENVLVGPGSKELMFLVQLVYYGEIVLRSPCWVSYMPQARILGRRIHLFHTSYESGWKITAEQLQQSFEVVEDDLRPRLLVLNYPSNPTGHTYSPEELKEIAEVARKFEVIVLSDEVYAQLHHTGRHVSIARFCPERTIISSGLSKWCGAGGWRLGTFSFPPDLGWLRQAMAAVASEKVPLDQELPGEVVPGFYRKGGGYLIPDAPGTRWIATDPKQPAAAPREFPASRSPGTPSPTPSLGAGEWRPRVTGGGIKVVRKPLPRWDHAGEKTDLQVGSCS